MALLNIRIDRNERIAFFSGPGTFHAKEKIKEIGASRARWNPASKEWEIRQFTLSVEQLSETFDDISVEEIGGSEETQSRKPSSSPASAISGSPASATSGLAKRAPKAKMQAQVSNLLSETSATINKSQQEKGVPSGYSVSALVDEVKSVLRNAFPHTLHLHGVLRSVKEAGGGRVYMDLADADATDTMVNCVIWRDAERVLAPLTAAGFALEAELQVMFKVEVSLNPRRASLSLVVVGVVPEYTIGKLAALREKTNERLKAEGLFQQNKQHALAFLPKRLGVLTSSGGTVINDFRASLDESNFGFELYWLNVSVQGADAKRSIIRGVKALSKRKDLDAILLFRGGGSAGDLAVFSEYEVAKAVCESSLPVFSAVGHQEDQSSVQDVSFLSFGVPKDLGRFFADRVQERRYSVAEFTRTILSSSERLVELLQQRVNDVSGGIQAMVSQVHRSHVDALLRLQVSLPTQARSCATETMRRFANTVQPLSTIAAQSLENTSERFANVIGRVFSRGERVIERSQYRLQRMESLAERSARLVETKLRELSSLERIISDAGPETQLKRGFAMIRRASSDALVLRAAEVSKDEEIVIQFADDSKKVKVQ